MAWTRRFFIFSLAALPAAARAGSALAGPPEDRLAAALAAATGGARPAEGGQVALAAPAVAEDGALVPVTLECLLPGADALWLFVEKNPEPLAAAFEFGPGADAFAALRVKMNESCDLIALARAGGEYFAARQAVRVVKGGCG